MASLGEAGGGLTGLKPYPPKQLLHLHRQRHIAFDFALHERGRDEAGGHLRLSIGDDDLPIAAPCTAQIKLNHLAVG